MSVGDLAKQQSSCTNLVKKKPLQKPQFSLTFLSYSNTAALCKKSWITMRRNFLLLLFVFFLPGLILFIDCITIGLSPRNLPLALVNYESDCSDEFFLNSCEANLLSCYFKQSLNKSDLVNLVSYQNEYGYDGLLRGWAQGQLVSCKG